MGEFAAYKSDAIDWFLSVIERAEEELSRTQPKSKAFKDARKYIGRLKKEAKVSNSEARTLKARCLELESELLRLRDVVADLQQSCSALRARATIAEAQRPAAIVFDFLASRDVIERLREFLADYDGTLLAVAVGIQPCAKKGGVRLSRPREGHSYPSIFVAWDAGQLVAPEGGSSIPD